MYLIYDILLHISLIILFPYFIFKMIFAGKYRKGILERFGFINEDKLGGIVNCRKIWFHAVSVGETKAVMPLVRRFKENNPDVRIIFSTVTITGNSVAMKDGAKLIDCLIYFPLDFNWVAGRVVKKLKPDVFVVVEKEIWPNILRLLKKNKIPAIIVNACISDRSYKRYRVFRFFFTRILNDISCFLCQTKNDSDKAIALGMETAKVIIAGNIKYDISYVEWPVAEMGAFTVSLNIKDGDKVIVAGSTHAGEEVMILDAFKKLKQEFLDLRLIIAPRHPERFKEVENLINEKGFTVIRRTAATHSPSLQGSATHNVILLDTIGELSKIYSIASAAFVGGTLVNIGGHNLLEPAFYKKPVVYGPFLNNYIEMAEMLESAGGGIRVTDTDSLFNALKWLVTDSSYAEKIGKAANGVLIENRGAADKCLKVIEDYYISSKMQAKTVV